MYLHLPQLVKAKPSSLLMTLHTSCISWQYGWAGSKLLDVYSKIKSFCNDSPLKINVEKRSLLSSSQSVKNYQIISRLYLTMYHLTSLAQSINLLGITLTMMYHYFIMAAHTKFTNTVAQKYSMAFQGYPEDKLPTNPSTSKSYTSLSSVLNCRPA